MSGWKDEMLPVQARGLGGWGLMVVRGLVLAVLTYGGLAVLLMIRLIEAPLCAPARPASPFVTQAVCRAAFAVMALPLTIKGQPMAALGAVVANHSSWLDIFALNAAQRVYFVSKSEVAGWPGIGWLARATGTVFIARKGNQAKVQQEMFEARLRMGHRLLFFPEGTSTDAARVLPFKSTLFQAFYTHGLDHILQIQPVTVVYGAPQGQDARFYGWWGEMDFAPHLMMILAARRQGRVEVIFHEAVAVDAFSDRKALAAHCEAVIRGAHPYGAA
jgi:1-acyl-sn-glycerol-3-phosphate acyltransferase